MVPAVNVDDRRESPQATSSISASAPQFAATINTAVNKAIGYVTKDSMARADMLLQDIRTTDAPKIYLTLVTNGPQSVAMFQTAGMGSAISVKDESMERVTFLLEDTMAANGGNEPFSKPQDLSSAPRRSSVMFQTTGKGSLISVSEDSIAC
jgi:hypothetical protein